MKNKKKMESNYQTISLQSTVSKKTATRTFTHYAERTKTLKTLIKTQRKFLKTSNLTYTILLAQGQIYAKHVAFCVPIGCARFVRYCGKMYACHLFPYSRLNLDNLDYQRNIKLFKQTDSLFIVNIRKKQRN